MQTTREARGGRSGGKRRRHWPAVAVAAAALIATSCEPVERSVVTVRAEPGTGMRVQGLSPGGGHVVVTATSAGGTVPGAGTWRVDRRDGSVEQVSDATSLRSARLSGDGSRILTIDPLGVPVLWVDGEVVDPPTSTLSEDLTYGLLTGDDGLAHRWDVRTGTITPMEGGTTRPPFSDRTEPLAISDDGVVAVFRMRGTNAVGAVRVLHTGTGVLTDLPSDLYQPVLSADGSAFAYAFDVGDPLFSEGGAEVIDTATGAVRRRYVAPFESTTLQLVMPALGRTVWVVSSRWDVYCDLPGGMCLEDVAAVALIGSSQTERFELEARSEVERLSTDRRGRFLLVEQTAGEPGPWWPDHARVVNVLDWANDRQAVRMPAGTGAPFVADAHLSGDGRLIVAGGQLEDRSLVGGWFEFTPEPEAADQP